jgi:hypothetical protein
MANLPAACVVTYGAPDQRRAGRFRHPARASTGPKNTGGGVAHTHDVTVPGASAHHHTLTPPQLYLAAWKRVS